ncbi:uncharacterized protein [Phaseolus vulgaris]|uniref:uncharacterized protein n=1 Tax=Phaseolus vulgaris TaxID=3885 RepID=UPI0035CC81C7
MELKDLIVVPNIADRLRLPVKSDKVLGPPLAVPEEDQAHEMPIHGEVCTISGGFSRGGPTASQRKRYVRAVNSVAEEGSDDQWESDLVFTRADLRDVVPHDNDPVVISVVTVGRKVHRVLVDQGSSADVMFWSTFNKLQLSPDLLRPYTGSLYGFTGDQVEVSRSTRLYYRLLPRHHFRLPDWYNRRHQPVDNVVERQIGGKIFKLGRLLSQEEQDEVAAVISRHLDAFALTASNMPGIDPNFLCHHLTMDAKVRPVRQRRRKFNEERCLVVKEETQKLLSAGYIREIQYPEWLANVVLVKKANRKWRMCVDFTDLNKACPKDSYPLPSIDALVDSASGCKKLSFLDAFSGYNQIKMHPRDEMKTAFMTKTCSYCYKVMPFGLKNAGATYQRLMDKVLAPMLGRNVQAYVDDMVVTSQERGRHTTDLEELFATISKYCLKLNPEKCVFGVEAGKFLGFMLTERRIEANPDKCATIIAMRSPTSVKEVQQLTGRMATLSRFVLPEEQDQVQRPIYFVSKALQGPESRYQSLEKAALAVVFSTRRLRHYFHSFTVVVMTNLPIQKVLQKPDVAGRMVRWAVKLSEFDIQYKPRGSIKGQVYADFVAELSPGGGPQEVELGSQWMLSVDGSSNQQGSGAGIVLEGPNGVLIEQALCFAFKASNNQVEYEALIVGMLLAKEMGAQSLLVKSDS